MDKDKILIFFKRRIEPFIALGVLILLIILCFQLIEGNKLRTEISQNCGWEDEDYRCFCEKSEAIAIKNLIDNDVTFSLGKEIKYVQMDR